MKVTIFGGSGFLGSHVADVLTEAGHDVVIYDQKYSPYLQKNQKMIEGDILDKKLVDSAVSDSDVVYNFAGVADIEQAQKVPMEAIRSNILGNSIILEACCNYKVKRFIFASTLYVYSKSGSFYRATKQSCELLIESYNEIFGLPYTILRYGSLYGPRADEKSFINRVILQALKHGKIVREGDGEEIREYIHVHDAARGSIEILKEEYKNQYVIISGNQQMKVKDLLFMIREILDNKIKIEYAPAKDDYHYEITPYNFSPKLARRIISDSYVDLGQGILKCIQNAYEELRKTPRCEDLMLMQKDIRNTGEKMHEENI